MKLSKKENKIRDLFQNETAPLDVDTFWDELEPKLEKKKKRRIIFWFLIGGLLLGYGWYQAKPSDNSIVKVASFSDEKSLAKVVEKDEDCFEYSDDIVKSKIVDVQKPKTNDVSKSKTASTEKYSPISYSVPEKTISHQQFKTVEFVKVTSQLSSTVLTNKPIVLNAKSIESEHLGNKKVQKEETIPNSVVESVSKMVSKSGAISNESEMSKKAKVEEIVPSKKMSKEEKMNLQKAKKKARMEEITRKKKALKKRRLKRNWKRNIKNITNVFEPWSTELDIGYGIEYGIRLLKTDFPEIQSLIDERNTQETMLETQQFGFHINNKHANGFVFEYGIDYRQMTQLLEYSLFKEITYEKRDVVSVVVDNYGNTIRENYGLKSIYERTEIQRRIYQKDWMVNIPISIGYFKKHRKFYYEILGGVDINIYNERESFKSFPEAYLKIPKGVSKNRFYETTGVGLTGSFKVVRRVTKKISIYAAPYFKYNLRPLNTKIYALNEKYHFVGLHVGMKVDLIK